MFRCFCKRCFYLYRSGEVQRCQKGYFKTTGDLSICKLHTRYNNCFIFSEQFWVKEAFSWKIEFTDG